jgi:hypothetical protein
MCQGFVMQHQLRIQEFFACLTGLGSEVLGAVAVKMAKHRVNELELTLLARLAHHGTGVLDSEWVAALVPVQEDFEDGLGSDSF